MPMCRAILDYLSNLPPECREHRWEGWLIRPVPSGNNRVYRVTRAAADWAVKFYIRDDRDRARREYRSLALLHSLQADIAPRPVALDLDHYEHAVLIQTWLS